MTPKSFWIILLKIASIYLLIDVLPTISQLLDMLYFFSTQQNNSYNAGPLVSSALADITVHLLLLWLMLFKTGWMINLLRLDKGFTDERFEFTMHRSYVFKIVVMLIGGILLIASFPSLIRSFLSCVQQSAVYGGFIKNPETN